ncbi:MAG: uroporphyrinogen-III synthase [Gammaproteobacteria bacterium]|nr:uroporphyrinogen-III synthase [Gammaproteobacteria bacterium]
MHLKTILLTRPSGANKSLADLFRADGLSPIVRPLIELVEKPVDLEMKRIALNLDHYDKIIFVSKSSVRFGLPILENYWPQWPISLEWLSVGPGTAEALKQFGVVASFPDLAGSEGLLALEGLQEVAGKQILIVRGVGGRELLGQSLGESGASVTYLETYRRLLLQHDFSDLVADSIVILTSAEILENFTSLSGESLHEYHAVVPSSRLEGIARTYVFQGVTNAGGASDEALYDAVIKVINTSGKANE